MRIVRFSVSRPVTVAMFTIALVLFGSIAFNKLSIDLLPDSGKLHIQGGCQRSYDRVRLGNEHGFRCSGGSRKARPAQASR